MTPVELSDPIYHDEAAARQHLEATRWPNGPVCPHCGVTGEQVRALGGASMGPGWYYCEACKDKFTVRVGTIWERSHIPLHKWLLASRLMASSKKGISAHQLSRTLNITYKSAWFLAHRIREAMAETDPSPLGGEGKTVEVDETFSGPNDYIFVTGKGWQKKQGSVSKRDTIATLVERGGKARSFKLDGLNIAQLAEIMSKQIDPASTLNTDQAHHYKSLGRRYAKHGTVNHSEKEYSKKDGTTTNTVEGFFSIFKRGMVGTYQHCAEQHLQRYLAEFDFRYSNRQALGVDDAERTTRTLRGAEGKRLTYRRLDGKSAI